MSNSAGSQAKEKGFGLQKALVTRRTLLTVLGENWSSGISRLLDKCSGTTLIVTSRELLQMLAAVAVALNFAHQRHPAKNF